MVVMAVVQEGGKESCEYAAASAAASPVSIMAWIVMAWNGVLEYCAESALVVGVVDRLNGMLRQKLVEPDEFCLAVGSIALTLVGYYYLMGRRHVRRRKRLAEDLRLARLQVESLQEQLLAEQAKDMQRLQKQKQQQQQQPHQQEVSLEQQSKNREVRIFMDGAFDMMHYGHMNAFRLARSLGTHLVVGINSDVTITQCKGAPLMNDEERLAMVKGCKFVDEVLPESCPYIMNKEYIDFVISKYNIDYVIHGDDPCIVDGKDVYEAAKKSGKFQSIPRTEGVSTTDIVGRMLLMTKEHHYPSKTDNIISTESDEEDGEKDTGSVRSRTLSDAGDARPNRWMVLGHKSKFLTTSHMLRNFSAGVKAPAPHMKIIYIDGAWDMFHCGHVAILEAAKKRGDYLIVGIHGDAVVNRIRGSNLPLMNLHERVLSVLGCRHVDDVLIDAPYNVTPEMVASLKIDEVVRGSQSDDDRDDDDYDDDYRHAYPKQNNMFSILPSPNDFSMNHILERIKKNQDTFQSKIDRKKRAEESYYQERYYGNNGNGNGNN